MADGAMNTLSSLEPAVWQDWRGRAPPCEGEGREPTTGELDHSSLIYNQERCIIEPWIRRVEDYYVARQHPGSSEEMRIRERKAWRDNEWRILEDIRNPFFHQIWYRGIEETRRRMVPAYAFDSFLALPVELQLKIWQMAARADLPKLHVVQYDIRNAPGSSRIEHCARECSKYGPRNPPVMHACRNSRFEALEVWSRFRTFQPRPSKRSRCCSQSDRQISSTAYLNTYHDTFYMSGFHYDDYKVLAHLLIEAYQLPRCPEEIQPELDAFKRIRFLTIDQTIFDTSPKIVWTQFKSLKKLTIAVWPVHDIWVMQAVICSTQPLSAEFVRPRPSSKYGKRAAWVQQQAIEAFHEVKQTEAPQWVIPEVETVMRVEREETRDYFEDIDTGIDNESEADENTTVPDDFIWYLEAQSRFDEATQMELRRKSAEAGADILSIYFP